MLQETETKLSEFVMVERAITYSRVSGDDRKSEGRNIASQMDMGREHCQQKGYHILAELFEDPNKSTSGADFDLPELTRALELAQTGYYDVLVVRELDRLARDIAKQLEVEKTLARHGVRVEYVLYDYPPTAEGELQKHIRAAIAHYEREQIRLRTIRGKRNKAKSGQVIKSSYVAYGYQFSDDGEYVINSAQAVWVKQIFNFCLDGMGSQSIADELNRLKVPTIQGGKRWYGKTILNILKNETYIGNWQWGKRTKQKQKDSTYKWVATLPDSRVEVSVPSIIDIEVFNAVQKRIGQNKSKSKRNTKRQYLMSGRMICGRCGAAVVIRNNNPHFYYRCNIRCKPKVYNRNCDLPSFKQAEVDTKVWETLEDYIMNTDKLKAAMQDYKKLVKDIVCPFQDRLTSIDVLIDEWNQRFDNAFKNWQTAKGERTRAVFANEMETAETTINSLNDERAGIAAKIEAVGYTDQQIDNATQLAKELQGDWSEISADFESRRAFLAVLDVQLTFYDEDKAELELKLPVGKIDVVFSEKRNVVRYWAGGI